ncbi:MAG: FtsX-like permease family protein [Bacteroidetes bacterium]|nr:FtsX-like permease family protein [Bacteroidota bacterium]
MNTELFIAKRLISGEKSSTRISRPIVFIAIIGISLGLAVMIIATAIVTGFKNEIRDKVIGFGAHIQILNYDSNTSFETKPVNKNQEFYPQMVNLPGIKHIQVFGTKAGIIKTETDIQGVVLKGVGSDFDWTFFKRNLTDGVAFRVTDTIKTNKVLISKYIAQLLKLKVGDSFSMYFVQEPPRIRKFTVSGLYETSLEEFDKIYVIADIGHIQKLNNWSDNEVSGFEILLDNFEDLEEMTWVVQQEVGFGFEEDGSRLKIRNIIRKYPQIFDWLNLQDMNVWIILILMLIVAGFNMVSGLMILILERTNMIGILKAVGTQNWSIRKVFLYQSAYLVAKGLFYGNIIGIGLCLLQHYFGIIKLDESSYYLSTVPINFNLLYFFGLNLGTLLLTVLMLIIPSYLISRISPVKAIRFD